MILRDYQSRAIDSARRQFATGCRAVLLVAPTGSGKTTIGAAIASGHLAGGYGRRVLWLAHRTELVDQAAERLERSGLTVGVIAARSVREASPLRPVQVASIGTLLSRGELPDASLVVFDECVMPYTTIGGRRADAIRVGDLVPSACGYARVESIRNTFTKRVVRINRELVCTWNHPIWIEGKGWTYAAYAKAGDIVLRDLRHHVHESRPDDVRPNVPRDHLVADDGADEPHACVRADDIEEPNDGSDRRSQDVCNVARDRASTTGAGWQRPRPNCSPTVPIGSAWLVDGMDRSSWIAASDTFQNRYCEPSVTRCDRSGWDVAWFNESEGRGRQEGCLFARRRVDSVEVYEPGGDGEFERLCPGGETISFQVNGSHTFFADGYLTHNCHHYVAAEWSRLAEHYRPSIRIGLTATPERGDGTALGALFDGMVSVASVRELTDAGYLAPCEVIAPDRMLASRTIAQDPVAAYLEHAAGERAIVFASHAKAAVQYATSFRGAGIACGTILDSTPAAIRASLIADHRAGKLPVLINVFVLTEGFDSPSTSVCILARGCGAVGTYLQMVGRVLRPAEGKRRALVIDLKGVSHVHGLPDDDRTYSLDGRGIRGAGALAGRFCQVCGALLEENGACVDCGRPYAELEAPRVVGVALRARDRLAGDSPSVRRARLERWREEGRQRGYKPGWAEQKYRGCYGKP